MLQILSALYSPFVCSVLLDEPDAHLHPLNQVTALRPHRPQLDIPYIAVVDYDAIQGKSEHLFKFLNLP